MIACIRALAIASARSGNFLAYSFTQRIIRGAFPRYSLCYETLPAITQIYFVNVIKPHCLVLEFTLALVKDDEVLILLVHTNS